MKNTIWLGNPKSELTRTPFSNVRKSSPACLAAIAAARPAGPAPTMMRSCIGVIALVLSGLVLELHFTDDGDRPAERADALPAAVETDNFEALTDDGHPVQAPPEW